MTWIRAIYDKQILCLIRVVCHLQSQNCVPHWAQKVGKTRAESNEAGSHMKVNSHMKAIAHHPYPFLDRPEIIPLIMCDNRETNMYSLLDNLFLCLIMTNSL